MTTSPPTQTERSQLSSCSLHKGARRQRLRRPIGGRAAQRLEAERRQAHPRLQGGSQSGLNCEKAVDAWSAAGSRSSRA
jgi:hypothetical protein